jgi:hypothetical protein
VLLTREIIEALLVTYCCSTDLTEAERRRLTGDTVITKKKASPPSTSTWDTLDSALLWAAMVTIIVLLLAVLNLGTDDIQRPISSVPSTPPIVSPNFKYGWIVAL